MVQVFFYTSRLTVQAALFNLRSKSAVCLGSLRAANIQRLAGPATGFRPNSQDFHVS